MLRRPSDLRYDVFTARTLPRILPRYPRRHRGTRRPRESLSRERRLVRVLARSAPICFRFARTTSGFGRTQLPSAWVCFGFLRVQILILYTIYRCIRLRLFSAETSRRGRVLDRVDFRLEPDGSLDVNAVRAYWGINLIRVRCHEFNIDM